MLDFWNNRLELALKCCNTEEQDSCETALSSSENIQKKLNKIVSERYHRMRSSRSFCWKR